MTLQNEKFEELISAQLTATLEPQRGKALAAFRAHIAEEARAASELDAAAARDAAKTAGGSKSQQSWANKEVSGRGMWFWTGLPAAVAACLAVVVTMKVLGPGGAEPVNPANSYIAAGTGQNENAGGSGGGGVLASQVELTTRQNGDLVVRDNVPTRTVTQQTLRQTQWFDPNDHATYTITQPGETVDYIQVKPN